MPRPIMPFRRSYFLALFLCLLALGFSGPLGLDALAQETALAPMRAEVVPVQHTTLAAGMEGRITTLSIREGDSFEADELLIEFDCSLVQAELEKAQAQLGAARSKAAVEQRLSELGSNSQLDVQQAYAAVQQASAQVEYEQARVRQCSIAAPYPGSVAELFVQQWQWVSPGQELMRIVDTSQLEVKLIVPSPWLRWLEPGHEFQVSIDETGRNYAAIVRSSGPWIDAVSQSVPVYATVHDPDGSLRPGMSGMATLSQP